jgi:hypothetical protein
LYYRFFFRFDRETTGKQYGNMRTTVATGRRPGTGNHAIPGTSALLSGSRSQTAKADETQTGWRLSFIKNFKYIIFIGIQ